MFGAIKRLFGGADSRPEKLDEARVCATALLVEIALSDGVYANIEAEKIREIIRTTFSLTGEMASRLLEEAEFRAERAADQQGFTRVVKKLPLEERERLVENLWRVAYADGEESPDEEAMVRKLADLLAVDPRTSRLARRKAADGV
jgi:uncharacterized tellurite resistance protein B-like protein